MGINNQRSAVEMLKFVVLLGVLGVTLGLPANSNVIDVGPRIVGGVPTDIAHHPWQLALLYYSQHFCGAVYIHPDWAITAAHCLEGAVVDYLSIRAGSTTKSLGGQVIDVVSFHVHPEYDRQTNDYDFALLRLAEPITVQSAAAIALPEPHEDIISHQIASISGWGIMTSNGTLPEILRMVHVSVVGYEICQWAHRQNIITDRMFCAGNLQNGGQDACQGDGGGPVVINGRLSGLVSWGEGCGRQNFPGVHAKVSTVLGWIFDTSGI